MKTHELLSLLFLILAAFALLVATDVLVKKEHGKLGAWVTSSDLKATNKYINDIDRIESENKHLAYYKNQLSAMNAMREDIAKNRVLQVYTENDAVLELRKRLNEIAKQLGISLNFPGKVTLQEAQHPLYPSVNIRVSVENCDAEKLFAFIYRIENNPLLISILECNYNATIYGETTKINPYFVIQAYYTAKPVVEEESPNQSSKESK